MTSKLTREQLLERARENVKALKMASRQTAFESAREEILADLQLAELALVAMDSEPVAVTDDELNAALQLHRLKVDGHSQLSDAFRAGFRYSRRTTPQQPVAQEALEHLRSIVADPRLLPRRKEWIGGQQYSYVLLEEVEAMVDEACRAAMLQGGNSPVIPEGWQVEAEKLAEMHGMSFVLFRHGEAPQCADPTKVVISFTDKGLGHDMLPAAPHDTPALNSLQSVDSVAGRWIPVSERMPGETGDIIVAYDGIVMSGVSYSSRKGFYIAALEYDDDEPVDGVTHWMQLPAAPQEVKL